MQPLRRVLLALLAACLPSVACAAKRRDSYQHSINFLTPQLTPRQFLLISSPLQQKVSYTQLRNFKSIYDAPKPLIDSGLQEPRGLAFDQERGALYIADYGAQKIFRYNLYVLDRNRNPDTAMLTTDGIRVTILQDVPVSWVTVDKSGDVFYSDPNTNSIGKIPNKTIASLISGVYHAGDLSFLSEMELVKRAQKTQQQLMQGSTDLIPTDPQVVSTMVHRMYEGIHNSHVSSPGGVVTDDDHVYWTNTQNGMSNGSVVRGFKEPTLPTGAHLTSTFPASAVSNDTRQAYGIAKSRGMVVFSSGDGSVYGLLEQTGQVTTLSNRMSDPRGLVWDGDQTVFVADQSRDAVWSLPVGRLSSHTPLDEAVKFQRPYGLALMTVHDHEMVQGAAAGLRGAGRLRHFWVLAAALVSVGALWV